MRIKVLCFYSPYMMIENTSKEAMIDETEFKDAVKQTYGSLLSGIGSEDDLSAAETMNEYRLVMPPSSAFKSPGVQALSVIQEDLGSQFKLSSPSFTVQELEITKHNLPQYLYFVAQHNSLQNPYAEIEMDFYYPQEKEDEVQKTLAAIKDVLPFNVKINCHKCSERDCSLAHSVQGEGLIDPNYEKNAQVEPSCLQSAIVESLGSIKENHLNFHLELIERLDILDKDSKKYKLDNPFQGYRKKMNDLIRVQIIAQKQSGCELFVKAQELLNESLRYMSNPDITRGVANLLDSVFEMIKDLDERNPNYKLKSLDSSHQQESAIDLLSSATVILQQFCNHLCQPNPTNLLILQHESDYLAKSIHGKEVAGKALKAAGIFSITLPVLAFIALPLLISPTFTLPLAVIAAGLYAAFIIAAVFAGALLGHVGNSRIAQAKAEQSVKERVITNSSTFFSAINPSPLKITGQEVMYDNGSTEFVATHPALLTDYSIPRKQ